MLLQAHLSDDPRFGTGYAVAAYAGVFVAFFGYLVYLHVCHRRLRRKLEAVERLARRTGAE